jgi:aminopeptidase C
MKTSRKITLILPEELYEEVEKFKKSSNIADTKAAVFELLRYALTLPPYFRNFDWAEAEADADADIAAGRVKCFSPVEEAIADLKT